MHESKISIINSKLHVPNKPIIPFIEGDGTGPDIWKATKLVIDTAVNKAYGDYRKVKWKEVYAGEKAFKKIVTYDFERLMKDATLLKCSEFGKAIVNNM